MAELAARTAYGRLLTSLARRKQDIAAAEDALADAFARALERWPDDGVPDRPEAWLLTAARRRLIDAGRRAQTREAAMGDLVALFDPARPADPGPDDRLRLMFVCAHPVIDPAIRTPLMLQTVLGLDAAHIGQGFLVSPAAMGQRLSRAKRKIKDAGIAFDMPEPEEAADRLAAVLDAVYAAYTDGWADYGAGPEGLAGEALFLAGLVAEFLQGEAEAHGLLALLRYCQSRHRARRGLDGGFVPLAEQDTALWDHRLIAQAEAGLRRALALGPPGRFSLEAAIQSVHAARAVTGRTDWTALARLYDGLIAQGAGLGAHIARACVQGEIAGPAAALAGLDALETSAGKALAGHQPFHAARAHWLAQAGQAGPAREAYGRAIALTADPAVRDWLQARRAAL